MKLTMGIKYECSAFGGRRLLNLRDVENVFEGVEKNIHIYFTNKDQYVDGQPTYYGWPESGEVAFIFEIFEAYKDGVRVYIKTMPYVSEEWREKRIVSWVPKKLLEEIFNREVEIEVKTK